MILDSGLLFLGHPAYVSLTLFHETLLSKFHAYTRGAVVGELNTKPRSHVGGIFSMIKGKLNCFRRNDITCHPTFIMELGLNRKINIKNL